MRALIALTVAVNSVLSSIGNSAAYEIAIQREETALATARRLYTGDASFRCRFADGRAVNDQGQLDSTGLPVQWFQERYNNFVFDAAEGTLAVQGQTTRWNVIRHGNNRDDLIAHLPSNVDPLFNLLRIEVWADPIRFWMTDGTDSFSGLCDRLR